MYFNLLRIFLFIFIGINIFIIANHLDQKLKSEETKVVNQENVVVEETTDQLESKVKKYVFYFSNEKKKEDLNIKMGQEYSIKTIDGKEYNEVLVGEEKSKYKDSKKIVEYEAININELYIKEDKFTKTTDDFNENQRQIKQYIIDYCNGKIKDNSGLQLDIACLELENNKKIRDMYNNSNIENIKIYLDEKEYQIWNLLIPMVEKEFFYP